MNKPEINVVGIDVDSYELGVKDFDAFIKSLSSEDSPLSAMLDRLDAAADEQWDDFECAKPVTLLEISRKASSGLPSGTLA